ncbi:hypothetical protein LT493_29890 [Streptomyces tricolor]|nr:hypothetical protein [Streptomyces tricolor]
MIIQTGQARLPVQQDELASAAAVVLLLIILLIRTGPAPPRAGEEGGPRMTHAPARLAPPLAPAPGLPVAGRRRRWWSLIQRRRLPDLAGELPPRR